MCLIVSGNVAYNKSALQGSGWHASKHQGRGMSASLAVDGVHASAYACALLDNRPFKKSWKVDLGNIYSIDMINIYGSYGEFMNTVHYTTKT